MATQFYHTRDPIENLRLRVVARKVQHGDRSTSRGAALGTTWSYSFHWQEKKSSVADLRAKKAKKSTSKSLETTIDETDGTGVGSRDRTESHGVALCSYVDADNYVPRKGTKHTPTTSDASPPHLVVGAADYHLSQTVASASKSKRSSATSATASTGTSNTDRVVLRIHREDTFRQMHVVLRITEDSEGKEKPEEVVLATLRYYPHTGLLCITPGFSTCIVEDTTTASSTKGPKLSTYHVTSRRTGAQFEYALDNENDLFPMASPDDHQLLRELQRQDDNEETAVVEEWRNKHGDHAIAPKLAARHDKSATDGEEQKMVLLEVVSAKGVDACDPLRIVIQLVEPSVEDASAWTVTSCRFRSTTRLSRSVVHENTESFAAFGHHAQVHLKRKLPPKSLSDQIPLVLPMLKFAVLSRDSWARERLLGHGELRLPLTAGFFDTEVPLVRSLLNPQEQLEEFFLGSDHRIMDTALAGVSETKTGAMVSRLGAQTISTSGRVRVRLNIIDSRPQLVHSPAIAPLPPLAALSRSGGVAPVGATVKRSVEEILQAVKSTKRYSDASQALASPLTIGGSGSSAVSAILARLQSQSTRGTSPSAG